MRLFPLCCALLLSACTPPGIKPIPAPPPVPTDLLQGCPGYTGPVPQDEGQLSDALVAEARGRACANGRLQAAAEILYPAGPR
jgi:hypothetical protein